MKVTIVGCSGSFPGPDSPSSSYLVEAEDDERVWRVVLDLGSGSLGPLQRVADLDHIDAVVISHLHPDHFMDLCGLYVARRYRPDSQLLPPLPVYGPQNTVERFRESYGLNGDAEDIAEIFDIKELADGAEFQIGPITIMPRLVNHPVQAFGVRVEHYGRTMAYSGDTDTCSGLIDLARDVDLLLAEASFQEGRDDVRGVHMTGLRAGHAALEARAHRLVLTHIPIWTDRDVVHAEAAQAFSGPIDVAKSMVSYVLAGFPAHM
jgi:ribonuclease BN (tRNA processing enzyme)